MRDYIAGNWKACLEKNGLRTFEDFWNLKLNWFEPPNKRRGGWSGVALHELVDLSGNKVRIFMKRQENHVTKTWRNPFLGELTFTREFRNILRYQKFNIPSLTPVYYGDRRQEGNHRAVLVTEELTGFRSLENYVREWNQSGWPSRAVKLRIIETICETLRSIHRHHLRHDCFFPKHILMRFNEDNIPEIRIIDLEKVKWQPWRRGEISRDLRNLAGESLGWTHTDRLRFYKNYLQVDKLSPRHKASWRVLRGRVVPRLRARELAGRTEQTGDSPDSR